MARFRFFTNEPCDRQIFDAGQRMVPRLDARSIGSVMEGTMFGFIGSHFLVIVLAAFGLFSCILGGASIADALKGRS